MKYPNTYVYPAVFSYTEGEEIAVVFPDLHVATSGENDVDALHSARELLGLAMFGREEDGEEIPDPTPLSQIETAENERAVLVDVFMPSVRMDGVSRAVNRTVTLPAWMDASAKKLGVNFSQVLQDALRNIIAQQ